MRAILTVIWVDAHKTPILLGEEEQGVAASNKCRPLHAKHGPKQVRASSDRRERLKRLRLAIQSQILFAGVRGYPGHGAQ
jgi:hypothetical protein